MPPAAGNITRSCPVQHERLRSETGCAVTFSPNARGDVGGESDDLERLAVRPEDRIVGRLPAVLADVPVLSGLELAPLQAVPEPLIRRALALLHGDEHRVGSSADVGQTVSGDRKEILVGSQDRAIHLEREAWEQFKAAIVAVASWAFDTNISTHPGINGGCGRNEPRAVPHNVRSAPT